MELEPHLVAKLKDSSLDPTQRVVEAIMRVGPRNAALISRLTGVPTETVRYKIKKQLKEICFRIHADVDYERLGLRRHWATIDFTPEYSELAVQILKALHEIGYLIYYAKIIPDGHYAVLFALPEGSTDEYREFLRQLVGLGIVRSFSLEELAWSRHLSLNPRYFDFGSSKWEIDWSRIESEKVQIELDKQLHQKVEVDKADLLLIKELQKDSLQSIIDVARNVKIHPKTLRYHYHTHVERRRLIPSYVVRWMRDIESTRAHSIMVVRFLFNGLDQSELMRTRLTISRIPLTWAEDFLKDGTYFGTICMPVQEYADTFRFISKNVKGFGHKLRCVFLDSEASLFTVPYQMYDPERGWILDGEGLRSRFGQLAAVLKGH